MLIGIYLVDKNVSQVVRHFEALSGIIGQNNKIKIDIGETYQITDAAAVQWSSLYVIASCKTSKNKRWNSLMSPWTFCCFPYCILDANPHSHLSQSICHFLRLLNGFLVALIFKAVFPCQRFSASLNGVVKEIGQTMASISISRTCIRLEVSPAEACEEDSS